MSNVIDNSQKAAIVKKTTFLPHFEMLEGPDAFKSMADPEARNAFESIKNENDLMDWLEKYDPKEYERLKSMTPEDHKLDGQVSRFISEFNSQDYYRFITGDNLSKEDKEMIELLCEQSPDFNGTIKMYQEEFEEMGFDKEKFRQRLIRSDAFFDRMREKIMKSQNGLED
jgi:hypothetical protein